jgi:hypothetical protein
MKNLELPGTETEQYFVLAPSTKPTGVLRLLTDLIISSDVCQSFFVLIVRAVGYTYLLYFLPPFARSLTNDLHIH